MAPASQGLRIALPFAPREAGPTCSAISGKSAQACITTLGDPGIVCLLGTGAKGCVSHGPHGDPSVGDVPLERCPRPGWFHVAE